jgi:hypothetical protein
MAQTKVVALERGHDGRILREAGEVFDLDVADPRFKGSTWFAPVDKAPKPTAKKADPKARPLGAGPLPGSAVQEDPPGNPDGDLV